MQNTDEIIESWSNEIDKNSNLSFIQKIDSKAYVKALLKNDAVVIFDIYHFSSLVGIKPSALLRMCYCPNSFYYNFYLKKKNGDSRPISAPYPSLKCIQRWIYENILAKISVSSSAKGFIPSLSLLDNVRPHLNQNSILQMDISNFFPSIDIDRVLDVFRNIGYATKVSDLLSNLCCQNGVLPQGAPTSPVLSNIILKDLDKRLLKLAEKYHLIYTRYVDDITFSGNHIPYGLDRLVSYIMEEEGFSSNENKTRLIRGNKKKIVTGISVNNEYLTIPRKKKREIRQIIYHIRTKGLANHMEKTNNIDLIFNYRLLGYLNFWRLVEPENNYVLNSIKFIKSQL